HHSRDVLCRHPPYHTRRFSRFLGAYPDRECCSLRLLLRIAEDSVLAHIQPLQFLLGTDPKPDRHLDDVEDQQGRHKDEGERGQHSAQLHQELVKSSPIEQSGLSDRQQLDPRSEEHTSELQSRSDLVCRLLLEKKKQNKQNKRG